MNTQKVEDAFAELVDENVEEALKLVTGMFVGLLLSYMELRGYATDGQIMVDGGNSRDITISAKKPSATH
jgi:hypothetical protein